MRAAASARSAALARSAWQFFVTQSFSSLTRRIVFLNLTGLVALVHRRPLPHAIPRRPDRRARAKLAGARRDHRRRDRRLGHGGKRRSHHRSRAAARIAGRRKLRAAGRRRYPASNSLSTPSASRRCCAAWSRRPRRARASTTATAFSFSIAAISTAAATCCASICRAPTAEKPGIMERAFIAIRRWFGRGDLPLYKELGPENGKGYPEVSQALNGMPTRMVRVNDRGEVIVSVAVPVQRFRAVRGALMLSTQGADIDDMVEAERLAIVKVFLDRCRRHGGALHAARRHHRRPGAAACRRRRARAPAHPHPRRNSRLHPPPRRDRAFVRSVARHDQRALHAASRRSRVLPPMWRTNCAIR